MSTEFAGEAEVIMGAYLNTLINREDDKASTGTAEETNTEIVDFKGFGTEHASFLLKQSK